MATRAKVRETARAQATRSGRVPQSAIDAELKAFDDKDLRSRYAAVLVPSQSFDWRRPATPVLGTDLRTTSFLRL